MTSTTRPGSANYSRGVLGVFWFCAAVGVAMLGWCVFDFVEHQRRDDYLASHGIAATATIVSGRVESSDGTADFFVTLHVLQCECDIEKKVATPDGHAIGSSVPIRYEQGNPRNLVLLDDNPRPDYILAICGALLVVLGAVGVRSVINDRKAYERYKRERAAWVASRDSAVAQDAQHDALAAEVSPPRPP